MQVVSFESAKRFKSAQARAGIQEYSFRDEFELCAFVAGEIRSAKIKYTKLADKCGVCPSTISNLANDVTKSPRAATLLKILKALGFEVFVRG